MMMNNSNAGRPSSAQSYASVNSQASVTSAASYSLSHPAALHNASVQSMYEPLQYKSSKAGEDGIFQKGSHSSVINADPDRRTGVFHKIK